MKNLCKAGAFFAGLFSFVLLPLQSLNAQAPTITGISPVAAAKNNSVLINGTNFSTNISDNIVWFGGVKATVTAANATSLTVTVPAGAGNPVRVLSSNLIAESPVQFIYTFPGQAALSSSSFTALTPSQAYVIQNGSYNGLQLHSIANLKYADLDGDQKPDMIAGRQGLYVQFNTSTPGFISVGTEDNGNVINASFEARYNGGIQGVLSELTSYQTNAAQEGDVDFGDIDGDGKLDLVSCVYRPSNSDRISVFRNITTVSGALSNSNFDAPITYSTGGRWARRLRLADFDNDGKLDILVSTSGGGGAMFRNTSTPGSISFAAIANLSASISEDYIEVADIDGDGKTDIVARPYGSSEIKVLLNNSSGIGSISFAAAQSFSIEAGGTGIELGDLDGDGLTDVLASGNSGSLYLLRNTSSSGSASFAAFYKITTSTGFNIADATLGDLDGDGKIDIAFNDGNYTIYAIKNNSTSGSLSFDPDFALNPLGGLSQYASEVVIQDIDGDGKNDVVSASTYSNGIHYFTNNTASSTLPVSWLNFSAQPKREGVLLQWATASEKNNSYFDVERSSDEGRSFHAIGRVAGSSNSSISRSYQWLDAAALPKAWYRIKQVDIDQAVRYSKVLLVKQEENIDISVSPNPVNHRLELRLPARLNGRYLLRIFDQQGKQVAHKQVNSGITTFDCSALPAGLYRLLLYNGNTLLSTKTFAKQ